MTAVLDNGYVWFEQAVLDGATATSDEIMFRRGRDSATIMFESTHGGTLNLLYSLSPSFLNQALTPPSGLAIVANTLVRIILADGPSGATVPSSRPTSTLPCCRLQFVNAAGGAAVITAKIEAGGVVDAPPG